MIKECKIEGFKTREIDVDFCVVGGGMAGLISAISASRSGTRVALMQDRPVLGGNASSEIRMWIRGAHGDNMRESGILEEISLQNIFENPRTNFHQWDGILFGKALEEKNITLIMNCSCLECEVDKNRIVSVTGWQTTTQEYVKVRAKIFADCSGDSVLAPLCGAEWRMGREGRDEFSEDIAPKTSDNCTMGMSCLLQAKECESKVAFHRPSWVPKLDVDYVKKKINYRNWANDNFWWLELGGMADSIKDTEKLRDELLKIAYGVWDFIKNSGEVEDSDNWDLDFIGFLPGKRESRRYVGDHILTQNDVRSEGHFEDTVAYGGWTMDDHNPKGWNTLEPATIFHPAPSPYGIPYRCLYSKNIENLMFAGRNISATHSALSSTRVMATCAIMGQAVGTAVGIAIRDGLLPRDISDKRIDELQQTLIIDDCYLPTFRRKVTPLMEKVTLSANSDTDKLKDGIMRKVGETDHAYEGLANEEIKATLDEKTKIWEVRLILDSDLNRKTLIDIDDRRKTFPMHCNVKLNTPPMYMPKTLLRDFDIIADGVTVFKCRDNIKRLVKIPINLEVKEIKLLPLRTWGAPQVRIYHFELL